MSLRDTARTIQAVALVGVVTMTAALAYGIWAGGLMKDGALIARLPWGLVTLIDIYVGILLFSCWVVYREHRLLTAAIWVVAILSLGNLVTCCYVLLAARQSNGDMKRFWMGERG